MSSSLHPGTSKPGSNAAATGIVIEAPNSQRGRSATRVRSRATTTNFELYAWLFMRISGLLLVVLVLGHLYIMMVADGGVSRINFAFVAGRWSNPFWQTWDLLQLWLAQIHGTIGLRTVINDYAERDLTRFWLKMVLYLASAFTVILGTLVIFTFDPNI